MEKYDLYICDTYVVITYFIKGKMHQYKITMQ